LDGASVGRDVTVRFGLSGMGAAPAGVARKHTGHHHLLIDVATLPPAGQRIPNDERHEQFGGGGQSGTVHLAPGTHTLQLGAGDGNQCRSSRRRFRRQSRSMWNEKSRADCSARLFDRLRECGISARTAAC
jgi:hypothetical protein